MAYISLQERQKKTSSYIPLSQRNFTPSMELTPESVKSIHDAGYSTIGEPTNVASTKIIPLEKIQSSDVSRTKVPFMDATFKTPFTSTPGVFGGQNDNLLSSTIKYLVETPEKLFTSYQKPTSARPVTLENITKPDPIKTYQEDNAAREQLWLKKGLNPTLAQQAAFAETAVMTALDASVVGSLFSGLVKNVFRRVVMPNLSKIEAWEAMGRPSTYAEAELMAREAKNVLRSKIPQDTPLFMREKLNADIVNRVNKPLEILRKEGIPNQPTLATKRFTEVLMQDVEDVMRGVRPMTEPIAVAGQLPGTRPIGGRVQPQMGLSVKPVESVGYGAIPEDSVTILGNKKAGTPFVFKSMGESVGLDGFSNAVTQNTTVYGKKIGETPTEIQIEFVQDGKKTVQVINKSDLVDVATPKQIAEVRIAQLEAQKEMLLDRIANNPVAHPKNSKIFDNEGRVKELGDLKGLQRTRFIEDRIAESGIGDPRKFADAMEQFKDMKAELKTLSQEIAAAKQEAVAIKEAPVAKPTVQKAPTTKQVSTIPPGKVVLKGGTKPPSVTPKSIEEGIRPPAEDITRAEDVLLRAKIRDMSRAARTGARASKALGRTRSAIIRAIADYHNLTDGQITKILGGRNFRIMTTEEFEALKVQMDQRGALESEKSSALMDLKATIFENELVAVDNLRKAMQLPAIENMSIDQLKNFDELLKTFKPTDKFLTPKKIEAINKTDLRGAVTIREAREKLAEKLGMPVDQLDKIKVGELDTYRWDTAFAERNPFYKLVAEGTNAAILEGDARVFEIEKRVNELFGDARKGTGLGNKIVPTDPKIWDYLSAEDKTPIMLTMNESELKAAKFVENEFSKALQYAYENNILSKSSYEGAYVTHVRRDFLEALSEGGLKSAFKELFEKYADDKAFLDVIDHNTKNVISLQKFFKFALNRSGNLVPTKNVAKAFLEYMRTFERKRALDKIIPEIMTYVDVLADGAELTKNGLKDESLKSLITEYLNTKKGIRSTIFAKPGGKLDFGLQTLKAFTVFHDMALNWTLQLASYGGVHTGLYTSMGLKNYAIGRSRFLTSRGRQIARKFENFTGKTPWDEIFEASKGLPEKAYRLMFAGFRDATTRGNKIFLLGEMTPAEWEAGVVSPARLAEMQTKLGRWLPVHGTSSIKGATTEGKMGTQYKTWALPPLRTTVKDLGVLLKMTKEGENIFKTREFWELFRIVQLGAIVALTASAVGYDKNKKASDSTWIEMLKNKTIRDSLSMVSAVDPQTYTSVPRTVTFTTDLMKALGDLIRLTEYKSSGAGYKEGDLKAPNEFGRLVTPVLLNQLTSPSGETTGLQKKSSLEKKSSLKKKSSLQKKTSLNTESNTASSILAALTGAQTASASTEKVNVIQKPGNKLGIAPEKIEAVEYPLEKNMPTISVDGKKVPIDKVKLAPAQNPSDLKKVVITKPNGKKEVITDPKQLAIANRIKDISDQIHPEWTNYLIKLAFHESSLGSSTVNTANTNKTTDRGVFQLNDKAFPIVSDTQAHNLDFATLFAISLISEGRQHKWSANDKAKASKIVLE